MNLMKQGPTSHFLFEKDRLCLSNKNVFQISATKFISKISFKSPQKIISNHLEGGWEEQNKFVPFIKCFVCQSVRQVLFVPRGANISYTQERGGGQTSIYKVLCEWVRCPFLFVPQGTNIFTSRGATNIFTSREGQTF